MILVFSSDKYILENLHKLTNKKELLPKKNNTAFLQILSQRAPKI